MKKKHSAQWILFFLYGFLVGGCELDLAQPKYQMINYWAEWCAPCLKEIPVLNCIAQHREDVEVIGLYWGGVAQSSSAIQDLASRLGIEYTVQGSSFHDADLWGEPEGLPVTILLGKEGVLQYVWNGEQSFEEFIQHLPRDDKAEEQDLNSVCQSEPQV